MALFPAILLAAWLFIGHIVLMVTLANRYMFRLADHPLKPTAYAAHAVFWAGLAVIVIGVVGLRDLGAAFAGQAPGIGAHLWPWLWFVSLAPMWGIAVSVAAAARSAPMPGLGQQTSRVLPADATYLRSSHARKAARWDLARVEITEIALPITRLPAQFDGFLLAHLSDLHYGGELSDSLLSVAIREARAAGPDLLAMTGDFVVRGRDLPGCREALGPLVDGLDAYAVLGNHDVWADREGVDRALREIGVAVLHNRSVRIERGGAGLWVAGVDDYWDPASDLDAALAPVPPGEPVVLLAHNPDQVIAASVQGVMLQLSGHTHGGQIAPPILGPFVVPSQHGRRFARGLHRVGDAILYVNRGMAVHPPIRIGSIPQVALITLTCGASITHTAASDRRTTGERRREAG